jgi:methyltransferase
VTGVSTAIALSAVLAAIVGSRLLELRRSGENERKLLARGGSRVPGDLFPALAALHSGFILDLLLEVWTAGTAPSAWWPFWLFLWASGEGLRVASIRALADRWTVRLLVVPGEARVRRGPYRFLRHPNYVSVAIELAAVPMLFGAWRTALVVSAVNAAILAARVSREERALETAQRAAPPAATS